MPSAVSHAVEPRPGRAYLSDNNQYILPEVFVQRVGDDFVVTTNNEQISTRINTYKDLMTQTGNSPEVLNYIREKIRAGKISDQEPAPAAGDHSEYWQ